MERIWHKHRFTQKSRNPIQGHQGRKHGIRQGIGLCELKAQELWG